MLKVKSGVRPITGSPVYWVTDITKAHPLGNGEVFYKPLADKYGCLYFNSAKEAKEAIKRGDFKNVQTYFSFCSTPISVRDRRIPYA